MFDLYFTILEIEFMKVDSFNQIAQCFWFESS